MIYCEIEKLKVQLGIDADNVTFDEDLADIAEAASRAIDAHTGRSFEPSAEAVERLFAAALPSFMQTHDIYDTTDMVVEIDYGQSGEFSGVVPASAFQLEPLNAEDLGKPYTAIRLFDGWEFPVSTRALVRITAKWGYAAEVPAVVRRACMLQAARWFQRKDSPYGVVGSATELGNMRLLAKLDADVEVLLETVRRGRVQGLRSVKLGIDR